MTLEDFFTLTEIKDGLMLTSRVEELVSVMQSNNYSVLENSGDAYRQWTIVASTISATKKRECLDVFVNLDGLVYIGSWLAMLAKDSIDTTIEESILALLEAIQNIGIDDSRLVSSGIWAAVKKLVDHGSSSVQDQARKLLGSWNDIKASDHSERGTETCSKVHEDQMRVVAVNGETSGQKSTITHCSSFQNYRGKHCLEIADEALLSGISEENNPDQDQGLELQNDKVESEANLNSQCSNTRRIETLNGSSADDIMKEVHENISLDDKICIRETIGSTILGTPTNSRGLLYPFRDCVDGPSNGLLDTEITKENKMGIYENSGRAEAVTSSSAGHVIVCSDSIIANMESEKNSVLQSSLDSNEMSRNASETLSGSHDVNVAYNSTHVPSVTPITGNQDWENSSGVSGHGRRRQVENDHMTVHAERDGNKDDKPSSNRKRRVKTRKNCRSSRSMTVSQCLGAIDRTTADIELGIVDALDVATKVAQEVAREVDSGEASLSSSVELSDESGQSSSQDSQDNVLHTGTPLKELLVGENLSFEEPHAEDNDEMDDKSKKPENRMRNSDDIEDSGVPSASKSEVGEKKRKCNFDLNQDTFPDEIDDIMSAISTTATTTTTTFTSVSHSVSAFGMPPAAPSQLGRTVSGNGSAATSVLHSAVPHKVPSGGISEKPEIFGGIDLNVIAVGDDQVGNPTPWKQLPASSSICMSGQPLHEANPWGSRRLNLDLNCMNVDYDVPLSSELKMETRLFLSHNAQHSAAPTSLSSIQQSANEVSFDLNDRPHNLGDSHDQGLYYGRHPWSAADYGGHQFDEPFISILGTKVDLDRKDSVSHVASSNGKSLEPTTGIYMARVANSLGLASGVSFSQAPIYGYNGLTGPPGLSTSAPMYVPGTAIPYKVDSRGTPVMMSQIIGSAPYVQPLFPQQHMFMSVAGGSPSLIASEQPNFDQSSGFGVEVGNRESISMRQFLSREQSVAMGEHSGGNVESSSNSSFSIGGKRKEPETRYEFPPWR